ncbi:hypothetical protein NLG97_g7187 [Lecanicillium saksenae]|uniref:Uncharacterized protein n=1 Tax=Lecanicillium saksenae TaxID=468837 RepID=A0ACC1QMM5_9HYPO|nr:hypothetical protein NLG97_g7187 [Lecanicillium saksenae]
MNHLLAFAAGVAAQVLVFSRGEWDSHSRDIVVGFVLLNAASTLALRTSASFALDWPTALWTATTLELAALAGLFSSMLAYRAFFHALRRFPGPFSARLSNFHMVTIAKRFRTYREVQQLHEHYGDIVRTGPSTLSVAKLEAVQAIHGPRSKCRKGPWYEHSRPLRSVHTNRDPASHSQQRMSWDRGLNSAALRDYAPMVAKSTEALIERIKAYEGKTFDANKWFNLFSFEVMGWMAFGRPFDLLATGKKTYFMELVQKSVDNVGIFANISWLYVLLKQIPVLNAKYQQFLRWLRPQLKSQMKEPTGWRTLFSTILKDYPTYEELTEMQHRILEGDMFLIIVAGSDTVGVTMEDLFYELSVNRDVQKKLQEEVDAYFAENNEPDPTLLAKLDYLQACINETLRLWPPVPSGTQRVTPPEGLQVGDAFIPGNTIVQVPTYTVHRSTPTLPESSPPNRHYADLNTGEEAFAHPNEFIPERWTTKPELIKDRSVFHPFSVGESTPPMVVTNIVDDTKKLENLGKYSCVGKQLALAELRQVTVEILRRFDVELAPGFGSDDFKNGLRDHFTLEASKLDLTFTAR